MSLMFVPETPRPYTMFRDDGPLYTELKMTKLVIKKSLTQWDKKKRIKVNNKYKGLQKRQDNRQQQNKENGTELIGELAKCESFLNFFGFGDVMNQKLTSFEVCRRYAKMQFKKHDEFFGHLQDAQQMIEQTDESKVTACFLKNSYADHSCS
jgi:hypothetical protein